jgi:hypothetical protein
VEPLSPHPSKEIEMKLYYGLNACSLAPLIAATEARVDLDLVKVDI